jgi:hypothetical protein
MAQKHFSALTILSLAKDCKPEANVQKKIIFQEVILKLEHTRITFQYVLQYYSDGAANT